MVLFCCVNGGAVNWTCVNLFTFVQNTFFFFCSQTAELLAHEFRFAVILIRVEYLLTLKALTHSKVANYYENLRYRYFRCMVKSKLTELNCKAGNGMMIQWYLLQRQTGPQALQSGEV